MLREFPELRQTAAPNHYAKLLCQTRPHHDLRHVGHDEDEDNECGQPEREPAATPAREFHAVAGVGLGEEVVPAPAPAATRRTPRTGGYPAAGGCSTR